MKEEYINFGTLDEEYYRQVVKTEVVDKKRS